jgi:hypothetical protein
MNAETYPVKYIALFLLCLMTMAAMAQTPTPVPLPPEFATVDGQHYKKAKITNVEDDGITIFHDSGISFIPYKQLPPDIKKLFTIDPVKEAAAEKARHDADVPAAHS